MPVDVLVDEQVARYRWFRGEVTVGDFFDRWCASDNLSRPKTVYEHSWEIRDLALADSTRPALAISRPLMRHRLMTRIPMPVRVVRRWGVLVAG